MFNLFKKKVIDNQCYAPVNGECISLDDVADQVFSSRMMGDGVAFRFNDDVVCAPCDGEIIMIANTNHAFGLRAENGAEILVHIGLDTVNLNGKGLKALVTQNQRVKKGMHVIQLDRPYLEAENVDLTTPMIITNGNDFTLTTQHIDDKVRIGETVVITCQK